MVLIILAALVVATLLLYTILAKVQINRTAIELDEAHVQALQDAGFAKVSNGYIKEDLRMSFQVYTRGSSAYNKPNVTMIFLSETENIQSEKILCDPVNGIIEYELTTTAGEVEAELNAETLDIIRYQTTGDILKPAEGSEDTKEELLARQRADTQNRIKEKMVKFLASFGFSVHNALGYETPDYITEIADENATFGLSVISAVAEATADSYVYTNSDGTIKMTFFLAGSKVYEQPHVIIVNKNTGITTTFVPDMGTMMCSYPEGKKQISTAYDMANDKLLLYQENLTNLTSRKANDEALIAKLKDNYALENKNVGDVFQMGVDMILKNKPTAALTPMFPREKKKRLLRLKKRRRRRERQRLKGKQ